MYVHADTKKSIKPLSLLVSSDNGCMHLKMIYQPSW